MGVERRIGCVDEFAGVMCRVFRWLLGGDGLNARRRSGMHGLVVLGEAGAAALVQGPLSGLPGDV